MNNDPTNDPSEFERLTNDAMADAMAWEEELSDDELEAIADSERDGYGWDDPMAECFDDPI